MFTKIFTKIFRLYYIHFKIWVQEGYFDFLYSKFIKSIVASDVIVVNSNDANECAF